MVGHDDALDAMFHGQLGVLFGQDPLDDDRQPGDGLQPVHILPTDGGVQGVGGDPVLLRNCRLLLRELGKRVSAEVFRLSSQF